MPDAHDVKITLDAGEILPCIDKFSILVRRLGIPEAERRLGTKLNHEYLGKLYALESGADTCSLRAVPTDEYHRALAILMSDETAAEKSTREETEGHVKGVEDAADRGLLDRRQAERLINTGNKVNRSHDLARGIARSGDDPLGRLA